MTSGPALHTRSFRAVLLSSFCGFGGYAVLFPVVPLWADEGGAGSFGAGATTGVLMLVTVLTQLGVPWLMRRCGERAVLVAGMALIGLPAPLYAISPDLRLLLAVSVLRGVGFGMLTVSGSALVAELVPQAQHGRGAARYGLAVGAPQLVLVPAGVGLVELVGFAPMFWLAAALPVLGMALAFLIAAPPSPPVPSETHGAGMQGRWVTPWLAMFTCAVAQGGLITFLPLARPGEAALVAGALFATTATALLGRLAAGEFRGRPGRLLPLGVTVAALGMLGCAVFVTASGALAGAVVVGGAAVVGLGFGVVQNDSLVLMFAGSAGPQIGAASAAWNIAYDTGTGVGAAALGAVAQPASFEAAFGVSAGLLIGAAAVRTRRPASDRVSSR